MTCSQPPPLTEDQLSALIDGDADAETQAHAAQCTFCAARLEAARRFEARWGQALFRADCPPPETIGDYFLDLLPVAEHATIAKHLQKCVHCQTELATLTGFLNAENPSTAPQPKASAAKRSLLGDLIAALTPNSPALALRGSDAGPVMATAEDGTTIFLEVQPDGDRFTLVGQLAAAEQERWNGALVELRQNDVFQTSGVVNDFGSFQLALAQTEPIDLIITAPSGTRLIVNHVTLSA